MAYDRSSAGDPELKRQAAAPRSAVHEGTGVASRTIPARACRELDAPSPRRDARPPRVTSRVVVEREHRPKLARHGDGDVAPAHDHNRSLDHLDSGSWRVHILCAHRGERREPVAHQRTDSNVVAARAIRCGQGHRRQPVARHHERRRACPCRCASITHDHQYDHENTRGDERRCGCAHIAIVAAHPFASSCCQSVATRGRVRLSSGVAPAALPGASSPVGHRLCAGVALVSRAVAPSPPRS